MKIHSKLIVFSLLSIICTLSTMHAMERPEPLLGKNLMKKAFAPQLQIQADIIRDYYKNANIDLTIINNSSHDMRLTNAKTSFSAAIAPESRETFSLPMGTILPNFQQEETEEFPVVASKTHIYATNNLTLSDMASGEDYAIKTVVSTDISDPEEKPISEASINLSSMKNEYEEEVNRAQHEPTFIFEEQSSRAQIFDSQAFEGMPNDAIHYHMQIIFGNDGPKNVSVAITGKDISLLE